MGEVPQGWGIKAVGKLFPQIYRYPTYYNIEYVDSGIPELRGELLQDDGNITEDRELLRFISPKTSRKFGKTILKEGDIILSIRGTMGKVGYVTKALENSNITANLIRMSPDRKQINPLFAKQVLISVYFKEQIELISSQTTIKTIKAPELKGILISTPTVPEQSEIAEILSDTDEAIEKTDRRIQKLKRIKQGLMQGLFHYGIDENGQIRSENTHCFKDSPLGRIPGDWEVIVFERLCTPGGLVRGPFGGTLRREIFVKEGYKVYEQGNAINKSYLIGDYFVTKQKYQEMIRFSVNPDDFILSCSGTIGKLYRIPEDAPKGIINQALLKITLNTKIDRVYFSYQFETNEFQNRIIESTQGGVMKNLIGMNQFRNTLLKLPPHSEQTRIASILSHTDQLIEQEEAYKENLLSLKHGLMEDLLSGKVRVNHLIYKN